MTGEDFIRCAFQPQLRPKLLAALRGDSYLRAMAQREIARIEVAHRDGRIMDRDHISKTTYEMLTAMLAFIEHNPVATATVEEVK